MTFDVFRFVFKTKQHEHVDTKSNKRLIHSRKNFDKCYLSVATLDFKTTTCEGTEPRARSVDDTVNDSNEGDDSSK